MRTRSRYRSRNNYPQREASPAIVEPLRIEPPFLEDQFQEDTPPESSMADNRTMAELLQAPTEGYEDAIVIPEITANNFELKHGIPKDREVVHKDFHRLLNHVMENSQHTPLESARCIAQAERYSSIGKRTIWTEVRSAITDDGSRVPNLSKRFLRNLQTTRASFVGSAFASTHFDNGPVESRVKHLLGSVVLAMLSPGRSVVVSLDNVNGFLVVYTLSDDLIRTDFEKKGVVPEVMLHILEEFVFLLGRHSLDNEIPRMIVCKVGKPWAAAVEGGVCLVLLAAAAVEGGVCLGCRGSSNVGGVCFGAAEAGSSIGSVCFGATEAGSNVGVFV
nr:reverse transcriptase domain-containing protein [Tanacetum cinerariifolium]